MKKLQNLQREDNIFISIDLWYSSNYRGIPKPNNVAKCKRPWKETPLLQRRYALVPFSNKKNVDSNTNRIPFHLNTEFLFCNVRQAPYAAGSPFVIGSYVTSVLDGLRLELQGAHNARLLGMNGSDVIILTSLAKRPRLDDLEHLYHLRCLVVSDRISHPISHHTFQYRI